MSTSTKASPLTAAQLDSSLGAALGASDDGVAQAIRNLGMVQQARVTQLAREAAALKQDGADDAELQTAETALGAAKARTAAINVAYLEANTPAPEVTEGGWVLHGRVFDADRQPAPGLTVFLVDQAKQFQEQFGYAFTDATGYFQIAYAGEAQGRTSKDIPLFVTVSNAKRQTVYLGTDPFKPEPGSTTYQNIFQQAGGAPLGDAPRQASAPKIARTKKKKTGVPPSKKKSGG